MSDCDFPTATKGTPCKRCGYKLAANFERPPRRTCPSVCRHLGPAAGAIKVECATCDGTKTVNQPAHKCAARGRCLPAYRPPDAAAWNARPEAALYHLCRGCDRFEPAPPP